MAAEPRLALRLAGRRRVALYAVAAGVALGCASGEGARGHPIARVEQGKASFYGRGFAGRKTASGERFDPNAMTAVLIAKELFE